ncbi:MAG: restriction endonuclease subunit S [Nitrospirae bacterium]|nr:restriction endonuclease subunit S [Nitrospirota bacterium]
MRKLKQVASVKFSGVDKKSEEGETSVRLCNYTDVYYHDYVTPEMDFMEATATPTEVSTFTLRKGDILITKDSESWDDIAVSAYVTHDLEGVLCGYHLAQIRPLFILAVGNYIFRAFHARGINDQFRVAANGITRFGIGKTAIDSSLFPVPPIPEQQTITDYLDRETSKLDALILADSLMTWKNLIKSPVS